MALKLDPISAMTGDSEEDTNLLRGMAVDARRYLESFPWCTAILDGWFGGGVGGVFAVFLFHIVPSDSDVDEKLWIFTGGVPSTYLAFDDAPSVKEAFRMYVDGMREWVKYARSGSSEEPDNVPPVYVQPTPERAADVERRINTIDKLLGPVFV